MVQRLLISNRYRVSSPSVVSVGILRPRYRMMNWPFLISTRVNMPSPVLDRPMRRWRDGDSLAGMRLGWPDAGVGRGHHWGGTQRLDVRRLPWNGGAQSQGPGATGRRRRRRGHRGV